MVDPCGVLEEGEIFFRCDEVIGDVTKSVDPYTFRGPVLVLHSKDLLQPPHPDLSHR